MLNLFRRKKKSEEKRTAGKQYYDLVVKDIIQETADAISIVFEAPEEGIAYQSGQFLTLIADIDGKEVRRSYSFCSAPEIDRDMVVAVKRVEGGLMSNYLADSIKIGDRIKVMEPLGNFTTEISKDKRHLIFFAGGSGITPFLSLIKYVLHYEPHSSISLIYANRDIDAIIFNSRLEKIEAQYQGRLKVLHILEQPPAGWSGITGLLNPDKLNQVFNTLSDMDSARMEYWMCGPQPMMQIIESYLGSRSVPKDRIRKESFTATIVENDDIEVSSSNGLATREVIIVHDGEEHTITVKPDSTILETGLDAGIDLPYSCQSGLCTACRCSLVSGEIRMDEDEGLTETEKEQGYVLICMGHPLTDDVKLKVG